jgi:hypothetical protein
VILEYSAGYHFGLDAHVLKHVQAEGVAGYIIVVGGLYHRLVHLNGRLEQSWHTFATLEK